MRSVLLKLNLTDILGSYFTQEHDKLVLDMQFLKFGNKKEIEYNLVSEMSSFEYSLSRIKAYKKQIKSNKIFLDGLKQELQLGERTTLDLLDGEQELLKSELDLVKAYRDFFVSYYGFIFYNFSKFRY